MHNTRHGVREIAESSEVKMINLKALSLAIQKGHQEVAELLRKHGAQE